MPRRGKHAWQDGEIHESSPQRWFARAVAGFSRGLTTESDRWFLWLPVLFAGGILIYFALPTEPDPTLAIALVIGAAGLAVALKEAPLGLAVAGALLMLASGFATAKLHTELARAPVLARELRYVEVKAWLETIDGQENGRTRATLRVIAVDRLSPDETPYRVRVTGASDMGQNAKTGGMRSASRPPSDHLPNRSSLEPSISAAPPGSLALAPSATRHPIWSVCKICQAHPWDSPSGPASTACAIPSMRACERRCRARPATSRRRSSPAPAAA